MIQNKPGTFESATPAPVSLRFPAEFARSPTRSEDVDRLSFKVSPAELDQ